ncbi:hypothetical protein K8S17_04935, partial [bacterium]|nr:hypothetical protein [bacterium]
MAGRGCPRPASFPLQEVRLPDARTKGFFITLEGVEGCGKSTQADRLVSWLGGHGHDVVLTREPGGTPLGERLRDALLDVGGSMLPETELFLYLASRAEHVAR